MKEKNFKIIFIMSILILFLGCEDKDKNAKEMLNEAIILWEQDKKSESILKLDKLVLKYPHTKFYQKALSQRSYYLSSYKFDYNPLKEKKDIISIALQNKLNEYFKKHNTYPNDIYELDVTDELLSYFDGCSYDKGISNFGFIINCDDISNEFMYINKYSKNSKKDLPINSFMAYYKTKRAEIFPTSSELVKNIELSNIKEKFYSKYTKVSFVDEHKSFKAQYVGFIETFAPVNKTIKVDSGYQKVKIIIDNKVVYIGKGKNEFSYFFSKKLTNMIVIFKYEGVIKKFYDIHCSVQIV